MILIIRLLRFQRIHFGIRTANVMLHIEMLFDIFFKNLDGVMRHNCLFF